MIKKPLILCVEDEPEVRDAVLRDLALFKPVARLEAADNVAEAREVLAASAAAGESVGLILCDHLMPGISGVEFLIELQQDPAYADTRKVLITGQAGLEDTVRAVNEARLHHYIAKPWTAEELQATVREQMTEFVLATQDDPTPFIGVLDGPRILEHIAVTGRDK